MTLFIGSLLAIGFQSPADAIVVRHDRDDSAFLALAQKYPATARVRRASHPNEPGDGGTLVDPWWILTAAHVAANLGPGDLVDIGGGEHRIDLIVSYPEWHGDADFKVDIALLRLSSPVTTVVPAQIYSGDDETGAVVSFAGYGGNGTGLTGPVQEDQKRRAATNRVELAQGSILRFRFDAPQDVGVTDLEGISGPGDSGGPAYLERENTLYVVGVSSAQDSSPAGRKRGHYHVLEYYARVSYFVDWIRTALDELAPDREP